MDFVDLAVLDFIGRFEFQSSAPSLDTHQVQVE